MKLKLNKSPYVIIWAIGSAFCITGTYLTPDISIIKNIGAALIVIGVLGVLIQKADS